MLTIVITITKMKLTQNLLVSKFHLIIFIKIIDFRINYNVLPKVWQYYNLIHRFSIAIFDP